MRASEALTDVRSLLRGEPVYLAGSLVASADMQMDDAWGDVDLFCPTENVLVRTCTLLETKGFVRDEKFERVNYRWLRYGTNRWHTNSMRMQSPLGYEINVVFKKTDGHATTSLSQVLESFDFGLLGVGWELETDTMRDLRPYLFPQLDPHGPLPMMPDKRGNWRLGFISKYNGLREAGRYAKYANYGYDLSLVKDDLVEGYFAAAAWHRDHFKPDMQKLGEIYDLIGQKIMLDDIDDLLRGSKEVDYNDSLDQIMEALE